MKRVALVSAVIILFAFGALAAEYELDLKFNPNRFNGLYGAEGRRRSLVIATTQTRTALSS